MSTVATNLQHLYRSVDTGGNGKNSPRSKMMMMIRRCEDKHRTSINTESAQWHNTLEKEEASKARFLRKTFIYYC